MEVRGLGLINIRDLFGVASTRTSKRVELVVQLDRGTTAANTTGSASKRPRTTCSACKVPLIQMPVAPGRNLAILIEVAARNQLLRMRGVNAARELVARLDANLAAAAVPASSDADADVDRPAVSDDDEDLDHGGPL